MKKRLFLVVLIIFTLVFQSAFAFAGTSGSAFTNVTYTHNAKFDNYARVDGIDVSEWQGNIDWNKVKASGVDFAIIRVGGTYASSGKFYSDAKYKTNIANAKKAGVMVGAYFFSQAITEKEAVAEATEALRLLGGEKLNLPVFMDYEFYSGGRLSNAALTKKQRTAIAEKWCQTIRDAGYEAGVYANLSFLTNSITPQNLTQNPMIWAAQYYSMCQYEGNYSMWQYTSSGAVTGSSERTDCNFWYINPAPIASAGNDLANCSISLAGGNTYYYEGHDIKPDVTVKMGDKVLTEGVDYMLGYINSNELGTAHVYVNGIGNYKGYNIKSYNLQKGISYGDISSIDEFYNYTGRAVEPVPVVKISGNTLTKDVDYTVSYENNVNVGEATIIVTGKGKYTGTIKKPFQITEKTILRTEHIAVNDVTYTGDAMKPAVTVKIGETVLTAGKDYDVIKYDNNINAGKAVVTVTAKGDYAGTATKDFTIKAAQAQKFKVTLSKTNYSYSGKTITPDVTVVTSSGKTLKKDTDFTVKYASGRKKIGKYKVTVTYKGNYSGSDTAYFVIGPKNPSTVKAYLYGYDDAKVTWSKVSGANGYRVYYKRADASSYKLLKTTKSTSYKKSNLADGKKYYFKVVAFKTIDGTRYYNAGVTKSVTTLKKVSKPKAAKSGSKVKVSWTNIAGETGYQISKSTSKSKTGTITTYKTTSGKSKKLSATKGKKYYYKVRAYKVVNGKKIYGPWSSVTSYKRK